MDATRKIQVGIHGLSLDHNSMCPGNWVHINKGHSLSVDRKNTMSPKSGHMDLTRQQITTDTKLVTFRQEVIY